VAILSFPPSPRFPRLSRATLDELRNVLEAIRQETAFDGVVIAANENSFATGADIAELGKLRGLAALEFARQGQALLEKIEHFPVPVVAAIRGFCLGGGLDLALACRVRVATYASSFGHPGAALGVVTGWGGTQRLLERVGRAATIQILLTGERIPATQALTLGLVDELVPSRDLIEAAVRQARIEANRRARES
jgi:enoyl-CoA hydratase/carnithine racemase